MPSAIVIKNNRSNNPNIVKRTIKTLLKEFFAVICISNIPGWKTLHNSFALMRHKMGPEIPIKVQNQLLMLICSVISNFWPHLMPH